MLVNVNGVYYVHAREQARWARSAGNSAIEYFCIIIINTGGYCSVTRLLAKNQDAFVSFVSFRWSCLRFDGTSRRHIDVLEINQHPDSSGLLGPCLHAIESAYWLGGFMEPFCLRHRVDRIRPSSLSGLSLLLDGVCRQHQAAKDVEDVYSHVPRWRWGLLSLPTRWPLGLATLYACNPAENHTDRFVSWGLSADWR